MTEHVLSRRRLLALAAATVTAGCGDQSGSDTVDNTRFSRNTSESSATPTATATGTDEDSSVEINIETETQTADVQERQTPNDRTETPEREQTPTGTGRLDEARAQLKQSITVYTDLQGVESVVGVNAAATGFDAAAVRKHLSAANAQLDKAKEVPSIEDQTIEELRTAGKAIDRLVTCQAAVIAGYEQFDRAVTGLFDEDFDTVRDALSKLELKHSQASDRLRVFEAETSAADFDLVEGVAGQSRAAKIEQFSTEITCFEEVQQPLQRLKNGLEKFAVGVDRYVGKDYRGAERELLKSLNGFEIASTNLIAVTPPDAMREQVKTVENASNALARGTDHLIESSQAGKNGQTQERQSDLNDAMGAYQDSGEVRSLASYKELANRS